MGVKSRPNNALFWSQAFSYLSLVEKKVSSAVAQLGRAADAEKVRRAASHALVETMIT